jgi:hypothetical protein
MSASASRLHVRERGDTHWSTSYGGIPNNSLSVALCLLGNFSYSYRLLAGTGRCGMHREERATIRLSTGEEYETYHGLATEGFLPRFG